MALTLDDFAKKKAPGPPCSVPLVLEAVDPKVRALAEEAMAGDPRRFRNVKIAEILSGASGMRLSGYTLGRHRNGGCRCGS